MLYRYVFLFLVAGLAFGCGGTKSAKGYKYAATDVVEISKGACFGTCPVYDFKIDGLGNASFEGKTYVKLEGKHTKRFTAEETNALFDAYKKSDFWSFENEYTAPVTDLPTTWISFYFMDRSKKIRCYYDVPAVLVNLIQKTEDMALETRGWEGPGVITE